MIIHYLMWNNTKRKEEMKSNFTKPKQDNSKKTTIKKNDNKDYRIKDIKKERIKVESPPKPAPVSLTLQEEILKQYQVDTLKEIEAEKKYKPPESWIKTLKPFIEFPRIISSRIISKEEYCKHYGIKV
jgi:hypothetical protein